MAPCAAAQPCALPTEREALLVKEITVTGLSSIAVPSRLPARSDVVIIAEPSLVDVQLWARPPSDSASAAADNPVRRLGPRLLIVNSGASGDVTAHVVGKEPQGRGTVRLSMAPLAAWQNEPSCIEAMRRTASADEHFARAQGVPGRGPAPGVDVPAEYRVAAQDYAAAAQELAGNAQPLRAQSLLAASAVYYQELSEWQQSADAAGAAQEVFRALSDSYAAARASAILTGADMELAVADRSRPGVGPEAAARRLAAVRGRFIALARFHQGRGERFDEALALNNAGLTDYYAGEFVRGIDSYRAALPIYMELGESPREAQVLQNIALMEYELGRFKEAKRDYARAREVLPLDPSAKELPADILNNLALVEYASGDLDQALEHYGEALAMLEQAQVPLQVARSLHGLGIVYYAAGDRTRALDYFTRALSLRSAAQDARGRTATLRAMAGVLADLGRTAEAIRLRREALSLAVAPQMRVRIEAQLALDLEATGQHDEAMAAAAEALAQSLETPRSYQALAYATRAQLEYMHGLIDPAQRDIGRALELLHGSEVATDEFSAIVLAARIARARGADSVAERYIDRALALAEQMRLETANPELRAGIWQGLKSAFDLKIDLLVGDEEEEARFPPAKRVELALKTLTIAEMYRARSLADYWRPRQRVAGHADASSVQLRELYSEIADRRSQLEMRLDRSAENDPRARALEADIARLRREADSLHRTAADREALHPETPADLRSALARAAEIIPADSAVIEYWLGETKARAWVITRHEVAMAELGAAGSVERTALKVHAALRDYSSSKDARTRLIGELSAQVIRALPAEALRCRSLVIIPDGALHYVPFAVLEAASPPGSRPLIDDHVIITAPSLTAALWVRSKPASLSRVLIVSDPVYSESDPRVARAATPAVNLTGIALHSPHGTFTPLPGTALEAAGVAKEFESGEVDRLSGLEASRSAFLGRDLSPYRVIHIAAHAVTEGQAPLLSALILSTRDVHGAQVPGQVFAGELTARELNAELVVLSACDTALGAELTGEGLLGLRYAVHAAGARSVVASLWPVADRTTTQLMTAFYAHYVHDHEPPAEALAVAMREVRSRFPDPSLWAAFEISAAGAPAMFATNER